MSRGYQIEELFLQFWGINDVPGKTPDGNYLIAGTNI